MTHRKTVLLGGALLAAASTGLLAADEATGAYWEAQFAPFAVHWNRSEDYKHVYLLGIERGRPDDTLWGFAAFQNSFGQPCAYAYYGWVWNDVWGKPGLYVKLSGGVLYGYKDEYEDKVPFNHNGFGLAIIPAVGWRLTPKDAVQASVLGTAGLVVSYNRRF
jgi:hypothetical protein